MISVSYIIEVLLYRIDPLNEEIRIFVNSSTVLWDLVDLNPVQNCDGEDKNCLVPYANSPTIRTSVAGINKNVTVIFEQGYFQRIGLDEYSVRRVSLTFKDNVTDQSSFNYNYTTTTMPELEPAVLEVRVW